MIYEFFRFWVGVALKFYYRSIHFINEHHIPENEPVIIAANHSNSAMDAYHITCHYKRSDLYWLARGDAFNKKWIGWMMYKLKTAPIYRASDMGGVVDHTKNQESFDKCFEILNQNHMIGIFPEGITVHERKLQTPLKKGTARLAFQAHHKIGRAIKIVPVGVSYRSLTQIGTDAFVVFGEPFSTGDFIDAYHTNPNLAINKFNQKLEQSLKEIIINYHELGSENEVVPVLEQQLSYKNIAKQGVVTTDEQYLTQEKNLVANWDKISKVKADYPKNNYSILTQIALFIAYPVNQFVKNFIKNKVKKKEFYSTVRISFSLVLFPIYLFLGGLVFGILHWSLFWIWVLVFPIIVYWGLRQRYQNQ